MARPPAVPDDAGDAGPLTALLQAALECGQRHDDDGGAAVLASYECW